MCFSVCIISCFVHMCFSASIANKHDVDVEVVLAQAMCLYVALCELLTHPGLPRWAGTRKVKPIWILLMQETVSGSGISWAICKSASCSRQTTTPAPHHSVFYRPDALPAAQPTASKHWRPTITPMLNKTSAYWLFFSHKQPTSVLDYTPWGRKKEPIFFCVHLF